MAKSILILTMLMVVRASADVSEWILNTDTGHWYGLTEETWRGITEEVDCNNGGDTWFDAQTYAETLGGYLAVINDESENQWIVQTFVERERWVEEFWFGMTDWGSEGQWYWINGEPVTYTNWENLEPNDAGGEDCVAMNGQPHLGKWNDLGCTDSGYLLPALIELEDSPVPTAKQSWETVKMSY